MFNINEEFFRERLVEVFLTYPFPDTKLKTCVDIGANVGAFSVIFSNYCEKVISIEPFKENFDYMEKKIKDLGIKNVLTINKAVSKTEGETVMMNVRKNNTDSKDISCVDTEYSGETVNLGEINTISLDYLVEKFGEIDYLKVDCEGCEYNFLYEQNLDKIKSVITEVHGGFVGEGGKKTLLGYLDEKFDESYPEVVNEDNPKEFVNDVRGKTTKKFHYAHQLYPHEFIFRKKGTPNYKDLLFVRYSTFNPDNVGLLPPIFEKHLTTCKKYMV
jgi:FkbM family methyltransferase